MATGSPLSSGSWGMKGVKASRETRTGRAGSAKSMRARGNSPVKVAEARRTRPGAFLEPSPGGPRYAGGGLAGAGLHPDGGKGVVGRVAFVGAVEDFPVAELTASAEGDGTGGDASEGEGDGGEVSR